VVGRAGAGLAVELGRVAVGRSAVAPGRGDRRFADPAWSEHPGYRRLMQGYRALSGAVDQVVQDVDVSWRTRERARFAAGVITSAIAPTNTVLGNPAALKRAFDTAGGSLLSGTRHWIEDLRHNGGMPRQVDSSGYTVGENLAATPGAVVFRNEVCEVLQYTPTTATVGEIPVLVIPPQINKYYFLDLAPGRSLVEHAVSRGITTFMTSWRNPGKAHGAWNLDTYVAALLEATDAVREISGSAELITIGFCSGGIVNAAMLSHLAATGDSRVRAGSFAVTLLDWHTPAPIAAVQSAWVIAAARRKARRAGVLDGGSVGSVFTWMRPDDLVWNYWVNNYLMGCKPPVFDILAWNDDKTNLPAALHSQFMDMFADNVLTRPDGLQLLGHGVDLAAIKVDTYVVGGLSDHLTPWQGNYRTTQLVSGKTEFVLSPTGHIQTPVSPPGPKAHYFTGPTPGPDSTAWRTESTRQEGTWWDHWADWVLARAGDDRAAPTSLGSGRYPALEPAPGTYVRQRL
jgi:polyhydroxyalkanoate synthase